MLQHIPLSDGWKSWTFSNSAATIIVRGFCIGLVAAKTED
jgi:hypothetical protein